MNHSQDLKRLLESIDHKGYPAYKAVQGSYDFKDYILTVDHVQGDPFASPPRSAYLSHIRSTHFLKDIMTANGRKRHWRIICRVVSARKLHDLILKQKGSGKSGLIATSRPGQEVLTRSACECTGTGITARFEVGFPALEER